jgi:hypothetical protein
MKRADRYSFLLCLCVSLDFPAVLASFILHLLYMLELFYKIYYTVNDSSGGMLQTGTIHN